MSTNTLPHNGSRDSRPQRWRALTVSQAAAFMVLLDVGLVNIALPSIQHDLGTSTATAQWVVSGYLLVFGLTLVPAGRLGDMFGRRRMFLIGLSAFVVASALTGAATSIGVLLAARLVQGIAGGVIIPQNSGLIQELFAGAERGRAFGVMGATIGVANAVGPVAGGLLLTVFAGPGAWRWVFFVSVPVGLLALLLAVRILPASAAKGPRARLDVVGALLLGGGVLCVLLPLVYTVPRLRWLLALAVLLLAGFAWWESRTARLGGQPLLDPRLARTRGFAAGALVGVLYFAGFSGVFLVLALILQQGYGFSPLGTGLAVTPVALGMAASAAAAGRLVARMGRRLTVIGVLTSVAGLAATALLLSNSTAWWATLPLAATGVGAGMVIAPNLALTLQDVPVRMGGAAGGALQTGHRVGTTIGTAALVSLFYQLLARDGASYQHAAGITLLSAAAIMLLAVVPALTDLGRRSASGIAMTPP